MKVLRDVPIQANTGVWASRQSAEFLLKQIDTQSHNRFLIPSFIAAIAAGIEGEINTAYVDFFHNKLGKNYKNEVRPYLFLRVSDRFEQLPLLLSGFKYRLNKSDPRVKLIIQLFELRNKLLHIKHLWHYADVTEDEAGNIIDIEYHVKENSDPYRDFFEQFASKTDLDSYMKLYNHFIPDFANIAKRITRKNFNPNGWFVEVAP